METTFDASWWEIARIPALVNCPVVKLTIPMSIYRLVIFFFLLLLQKYVKLVRKQRNTCDFFLAAGQVRVFTFGVLLTLESRDERFYRGSFASATIDTCWNVGRLRLIIRSSIRIRDVDTNRSFERLILNPLGLWNEMGWKIWWVLGKFHPKRGVVCERFGDSRMTRFDLNEVFRNCWYHFWIDLGGYQRVK